LGGWLGQSELHLAAHVIVTFSHKPNTVKHGSRTRVACTDRVWYPSLADGQEAINRNLAYSSGARPFDPAAHRSIMGGWRALCIRARTLNQDGKDWSAMEPANRGNIMKMRPCQRDAVKLVVADCGKFTFG